MANKKVTHRKSSKSVPRLLTIADIERGARAEERKLASMTPAERTSWEAAREAAREASRKRLAEIAIRPMMEMLAVAEQSAAQSVAQNGRKKGSPAKRVGPPKNPGRPKIISDQEFSRHMAEHPNKLSDGTRATILATVLRKPVSRFNVLQARLRWEKKTR